jgi:outer membrane protein OmpA-like peptidoglycan-associated protein
MKFIMLASAFLLMLTSVQAQVPRSKKVTKTVVPKAIAKAEVPKEAAPVQSQPATAAHDTIVPAAPVVFTAYQNYDFVPGDTVIFEDHFADDEVGEFPAHWNLGAGQAVMNTIGGQNALLLIEGNYAHVSPLIKSPAYFPDAFTIEYDAYFTGGYGPKIFFYSSSADAKNANSEIGHLSLDQNAAELIVESNGVDLGAPFPENAAGEKGLNQWHHIAIAYKKNQVKVYIDQSRVLVVPNIGISPHAFDIEGIGQRDQPIVFANFRIARGAGMNMLGKKFTDAKIVTHGINFDVNKATIRAESMGTLNGIVQILKDNPGLKFEVGGHTDSDGDDAFNMKLSQARADAVRNQLISMGIDGSRLTSKGYGESKPMSDNKTWEGKANNRRVEFVKK